MRNLVMDSVVQISKKNIALTLAIIVVAILVVVLSLAPPQLLKAFIDTCLNPTSQKTVTSIALLYIGVIVLIGLMDFLKGAFLTIFGQKMMENIRYQMMKKVERIKASYFTKESSGEIVSRFIQDVDSINSLFTDGLVSMFIDAFKIIGILFSILLFSKEAFFLSLCLIPAVAILTRVFQKLVLKAQIENLEELGKVNNALSECIKNFRMIKIFNREKYMENTFEKRLIDNYKTKEKVNLYDSLYSPLIQMLKTIAIAVVVILASPQVHIVMMSVGSLAAMIDLMVNLLAPIESLGNEFQNIQSGISGMKRINDFFKEEEENEKNKGMSLEDIMPDGVKKITFDHVSFYYEKTNEILKDFNLVVQGNSNVTLVGRTGRGKTTIFNLIMGLLVPVNGHILLNEVPCEEIPNKLKRKIFGYVEQNFKFVEGNVYDQISLKDPTITNEMVKTACVFADLDSTILSLPEGYETQIHGGTEFSWGQRQLLAIARAIVAEPKILLLDEISANLDAETEERVMSILNKAVGGRTILSISHREGSIMASSTIVDMNTL